MPLPVLTIRDTSKGSNGESVDARVLKSPGKDCELSPGASPAPSRSKNQDISLSGWDGGGGGSVDGSGLSILDSSSGSPLPSFGVYTSIVLQNVMSVESAKA